MFHVNPFPRETYPAETSYNLRAVDQFDIGYLIGLIVGEGSFTGDRRAPLLSLKMRDQEPLQRLARSFGGKVHGPYQHDGRHFFLYHLRGQALRSASALFITYLPSGRKRRQFLVWAAKYGLAEGIRP
jgi:hypothetical protein